MKKTNDNYSNLTSHIKKTKVKVRFPNESFFEEMEININDFKPTIEFKNEVFGWCNNLYISLKKN